MTWPDEERAQILRNIEGKVIRSSSIDMDVKTLKINFTDGTTLTIESYIPQWEHSPELDWELERTESSE